MTTTRVIEIDVPTRNQRIHAVQQAMHDYVAGPSHHRNLAARCLLYAEAANIVREAIGDQYSLSWKGEPGAGPRGKGTAQEREE